MDRRTFLKHIALAGATLLQAQRAGAIPSARPAATDLARLQSPLIPPPRFDPMRRIHTTGPHATSLARRWALDDAAVASGDAARRWTWGAEVLSSGEEAYDEAPDSKRAVWYFDKGRLELTHPDANPNDPQSISSGPLVYELVSGLIKLGDSRVQWYRPAVIPIAGDDVSAAHTITYADLRPHASLTTDRRSPQRAQAVINEVIQKHKGITQDEHFAAYDVQLGRYDDITGHNIAAVFDAALSPERVTELAGHSLTEPYWATVPVGGTPTDVLLQLFERRVLIYTPTNPEEARVEWGNVGRHYAQWRYSSATNGAPFDPRTALDVTTTLPLFDLAPTAQEVVHDRKETVGIAVFNLHSGALYEFESGRAFKMFSTVKVPVMLTLLHQAMQAQRALSANEDRLVRSMIQHSDNAATSALFDRLGGAAAVGDFLTSIGLQNTTIRQGSWGLSTTTARDMVHMLGRLANGTILDRDRRAYALDMMRGVVPDQRWGISEGVSPEGVVAIKNGWYPAQSGWAINSIGIVEGQGKFYAVAMYTAGNSSMGNGITTIENAVRDVYTTIV